jgi:hypothetical protein
VGWELEICYNSIEPCWESGCGGMLWIEMLCGDWWLTLNIIVQGVVGVLRRLLGLLEWAFGNILGGGGISSSLLQVLMWGLGLKLAFGMIFGVGIGH